MTEPNPEDTSRVDRAEVEKAAREEAARAEFERAAPTVERPGLAGWPPPEVRRESPG